MATMNEVGRQNALSATTGAAVALTLPTGRLRPSHAMIAVQGNSIRWTGDGTAPTASVGFLTPAGANIEFMDGFTNYGSIIDKFRAIGISGTATLDIAYFAV
jgi:hypothetical protein